MATKHCKSTSSSDIAMDILSKLPVKSLVRFKSVSKSLSTLIRSSDFAAAQLLHSSRRSCLLLRHYHGPSSESGIVLIRDAAVERRALIVPSLGDGFRFPQIVGSCNGLVCLDFSNGSSTHLAVWNPATMEFRAVPSRRSNRLMPIWRSAIGFGFNLEDGDFRVLRVLYFQHQNDDFPSSLVESYSLRANAWTVVLPPDTETDWVIQEPGIATNANGALHWLGNGVGDSRGRFVVQFDLTNWVFKKLTLPTSYGSTRTRNCIKIMAFENTIAFAVYPHSHPQTLGSVFELWALKQEGVGWIRQCQIQPFATCCIPMQIWRGSEIVIMKYEEQCCGLFSYDTDEYESTDLFFSSSLGCSVSVFGYTESVVSVVAQEGEENGRE